MVKHEIASAAGGAALKTTPPAAVLLGTVTGALDMTFLVGAATFVYVVAQLGYLIWKWRREARNQ